jgi:hypothetical protein
MTCSTETTIAVKITAMLSNLVDMKISELFHLNQSPVLVTDHSKIFLQNVLKTEKFLSHSILISDIHNQPNHLPWRLLHARDVLLC